MQDPETERSAMAWDAHRIADGLSVPDTFVYHEVFSIQALDGRDLFTGKVRKHLAIKCLRCLLVMRDASRPSHQIMREIVNQRGQYAVDIIFRLVLEMPID